MDVRNYIPPDGGHVGCGSWQRLAPVQTQKWERPKNWKRVRSFHFWVSPKLETQQPDQKMETSLNLIENSTFKGGGGGGAYSRGRAYSKGSFPERGLIRDAYYVSKEAEFSPKKLSKS